MARRRREGLLARIGGAATLVLARAVFAFLKALGPDRASDLGGWVARTFGPLFKPHRTALENLRAAFPEKPEAEIRRIARGAWDNLGRTVAEYPHLGEIMDFNLADPDPNGRIRILGAPWFDGMRDDGRPGLIFTAHLANWEIGAVLAERYRLNLTSVYRAPNDPGARRVIEETRRETMGSLEASRPGAALSLRKVLEDGGHVAMLVDQHFTRGLPVTFFGRPAMANPLLAKLVRQYDCPLCGARAVRRGGARFDIEMTAPLEPARDAEGLIDEASAVAAMTAAVETWVREHPEQWLWMHRRWRPNK